MVKNSSLNNSSSIVFTICFGFQFLIAQSTFKIHLDDSSLDQLSVVSINTTGNGVSTSGENRVCVNAFNSASGEANSYLIGIGSREEITKSYKISNSDFNLKILKTILVSRNYYLLGTAKSKAGIGSENLFISCLNLDSSKIQWTYIVENSAGILGTPDFAFSRGSFFVGFSVPSTPPQVSETKILRVAENGNLLWEEKLNGKSDKSYFFEGICYHNNGTLFVAIKGISDFDPIDSEIGLINLNENGEIIKSADFEVYNQLGSLVRRHGKVFVKPNGSNIHVVAQNLVGRSESGAFFISMIDETMTLKTWRNYSQEIRVEDFQISPLRFLLSGQRPVENGKEGYAMVAINSLNAIPELLSSFKEGFLNSSIATSSSVGSNGVRNYILAARPNKTNEPYIGIALQSDSVSRKCNESFAFTVTKDKLTLTETNSYSLEILRKDLILEKFPLSLDNFAPTKEILCSPTGVSDMYSESKHLPYTLFHNLIQINLNEMDIDIKNIIMCSTDGRTCRYKMELNSKGELEFDIENLSPGIYFINFGSRYYVKFIKV